MFRYLAEVGIAHEPGFWQALWDTYMEIIQNPAHYLAEFTIEIVGSIIGVHTLTTRAHAGKHGFIRRVGRIVRRARLRHR